MEVDNHVSENSPPLYDDVFPALPSVPQPKINELPTVLPRFTPSTDTEMIEIPFEERGLRIGELSDPSKACAAIGKSCGVSIEFSHSKNKSLTVIVRGPPQQVSKAKVMIIQDLQQQAQRIIKIPQEYHGFLIGHKGQRKVELEATTLTKIYVPPVGWNSNEVRITGSPSRLDAAEKEIRRVVEFQAQQANERLRIPKEFHAFICGPYNNTINALRESTNTKIAIPPPKSSADDIVISGKKADVAKVVAEINKIYEDRAKRCITIPVNIQRDKQRLVIGARGNGLHEILDKTGVVVEPPTDDGDVFTLRGFVEDLGKATTMIFTLASSSTTEEVTAPQRLHKNLIGKKGTALNSIREGYESVRVDFPKDGDKITVEGPSEEVAIIVERLNARISELNASHHLEMVTIDPKHHAKLFGTSSDSLSHFIRVNRLNVRFPSAADCGKIVNESQICIEGDTMGVELVMGEIKRLTQKWDSEKTKDVIIDPRIQRILRAGNPPPIRQIEDELPEVSIRWPGYQSGPKQLGATSENKSTTDYVVQLYGIREQVDTAAEKLKKLIRVTTEENYEQETRIFKDCMQRILGSPIVNLLRETKTRIRYNAPSEDGSRVAFIIGRQEDVHTAIDRLENLQKSLSDLKEIEITLPSLMLAKQTGGEKSTSARLRSIREQCEGVHVAPVPSKPREILISGPSEAVDKAKSIIDSMCAKMLERCADCTVYANPKFHGALIGRGGTNLKRLREKYDVEILFPDRLESDPTLASEIHVIGEKEAVASAVKDFEQTIKDLEDETETTVNFDASIMRDLINYRNSFNYSEFERVKIFWPRSPTSPPTRRTAEESVNGDDSGKASVRIIGPNACVEAAEQCLKKIIDDIKAQKTVRHPVSESTHCQALSRCRSLLADIQRNHNVLINLQLNRDGFQDEESEEFIYGHIVLTGREEIIDEVLKTEIIPLLPVSDKIDFPQEFHGKLFMGEQAPQPTTTTTGPRGGGAAPGVSRRGGARGNARFSQQRGGGHDPHEEDQHDQHPRNKLVALQTKYNVSIQVPPRTQRGVDQLTVQGAPDAVESCKVELAALLKQLQDEKADAEARNYEECLIVEERFINRIITGERDRILKERGVAIFTRGRAAAPVAKETNSAPADGEEGTSDDAQPVEATSENTEHQQNLSGYKLMRTTPVALVIQGYKEKVAEARRELEELIVKFNGFCCEELHIPFKTHARLIGVRRNNIRHMEEMYNVEVEFPPRGASRNTADIVLVMGAPADVDLACDELINKANDLVDRFPDMSDERPGQKAAAPAPQQPPTASDFAVVGAPWE